MPKTLLLADDSVTIQKVVGLSFANEDVSLLTVDNGDDAISQVRAARPDIVLADVVMPGKNGYEVCEAIKSDPAFRHIPVLLLTGTFEALDDERHGTGAVRQLQRRAVQAPPRRARREVVVEHARRAHANRGSESGVDESGHVCYRYFPRAEEGNAHSGSFCRHLALA